MHDDEPEPVGGTQWNMVGHGGDILLRRATSSLEVSEVEVSGR